MTFLSVLYLWLRFLTVSYGNCCMFWVKDEMLI